MIDEQLLAFRDKGNFCNYQDRMMFDNRTKYMVDGIPYHIRTLLRGEFSVTKLTVVSMVRIGI